MFGFPGLLMYLSILAVGIGGALGSLFRWFLGIRLNGLFTGMPLGTFAANVIAVYVPRVRSGSRAALAGRPARLGGRRNRHSRSGFAHHDDSRHRDRFVAVALRNVDIPNRLIGPNGSPKITLF